MTESFEKIKALVKQFEEHREDYHSKKYDESNTRTDFIDKFFEALSWDVRNNQGHAENYREVIREDKIMIEGKQKAPDYAFRIGGTVKFYVEAKKPSVDIKNDIDASYQLRRYAYTAKLPLSILTDFAEFAVYDTRIKPKATDNASMARIFYCKSDEYEKHWEFIEQTFSKEAILKGSFDKYIKDPKRKKGTSEVDKEFLKQIESWREDLALNIALRNKDLSIYDLNYAIQKIIDRIIFLRIAEDRGMEEYGTLRKFTQDNDKKFHIYQELIKYFKKADEKYNSGLFDLKEDKVTTKLTIDYKIFNDIIVNLYYPNSPYEFSVLPIEILGNIYEQFLGKTIRLTEGHRAKVEDKPEVRKAGGVYYTPQYIVDYIVKNTLGEKLKDKTPKQIEDLTVLDPACGSGSFLITAYEYLLTFYLDYYSKNSQKEKALKDKKIFEIKEKDYKLSINEKRNILTRHIYGVDIDSQAVEVTKLSLLLKLMEDERLETSQYMFTRREMKLLPDLSGNIKCGNSLIGSDFYTGQQVEMFDDEMIRKINAFDWDKEFPAIFSRGGFDVVIGNPPYVNIVRIDEITRNYLKNKFKITNNKVDLYAFFVEKIISAILKDKGMLGYIISNTWLATKSFSIFRELLFRNTSINEICLMPNGTFKNACVETTIVVLSKEVIHKNIIVKKYDDQFYKINELTPDFIYINNYIILTDMKTVDINLHKKIESETIPLGNILHFYRGIKTSDDKKYITTKRIDRDSRKLIRGRNIFRFGVEYSGEYIWYRPDLIERKKGSLPHKAEDFEVERKIIIQGRSGKNIIAHLDTERYYVLDTCYFSKMKDSKWDEMLLVVMLNSNLINYWYSSKYKTATVSGYELHSIPIKRFEKINEESVIRLIQLGNKITSLYKKQHSKIEVKTLLNSINILIYKIYGLSKDEIEIVEKG